MEGRKDPGKAESWALRIEDWKSEMWVVRFAEAATMLILKPCGKRCRPKGFVDGFAQNLVAVVVVALGGRLGLHSQSMAIHADGAEHELSHIFTLVRRGSLGCKQSQPSIASSLGTFCVSVEWMLHVAVNCR